MECLQQCCYFYFLVFLLINLGNEFVVCVPSRQTKQPIFSPISDSQVLTNSEQVHRLVLVY